MCAGYKTVVIVDPTTTPHIELALEFPELTRYDHTVICGGYELEHQNSCIFYSLILHTWEIFLQPYTRSMSYFSFLVC